MEKNIRDKKGKFLKGMKQPKEWGEKLSKRMIGNRYNLGRKHTQEWKDLISLKSTGKKRGKMSEELRNRLSKIRKERLANGKIKVWNVGLKGKEFTKHYRYNFQHLKNREGKILEEIYGKKKAQEILNKKIGTKQSPETIEKRVSKMRGEKSHLWKGGITPMNRLLRNQSMYKIWREAVFLRDNFTCQNPDCKYCNNKIGVFLHSHHIKSFAKYPELRFNINNGITYCKEFHINSKLLHKRKSLEVLYV